MHEGRHDRATGWLGEATIVGEKRYRQRPLGGWKLVWCLVVLMTVLSSPGLSQSAVIDLLGTLDLSAYPANTMPPAFSGRTPVDQQVALAAHNYVSATQALPTMYIVYSPIGTWNTAQAFSGLARMLPRAYVDTFEWQPEMEAEAQ